MNATKILALGLCGVKQKIKVFAEILLFLVSCNIKEYNITDNSVFCWRTKHMKCRICGYELDGTTLFCPMCGSKVEAADIAAMHTPAKEEEFSWNTYDFPKPRQMQDIKMEWHGSGVMNEDASEGFVQTEDPKPQPAYSQPASFQPSYQSEPAPVSEPVKEPVRRTAPDNFAMPSWHMPEQKVADNTPLWATQPLWDARQLPREIQEASTPEGTPFTAQGYIRMPAKEEPTPFTASGQAQVQPVQPAQPAQPVVKETPAQPEKAPEQFNTFVSKNQEFQQLLQEQWNRARSLRDNDNSLPPLTFTNAYAPQTNVEAADVSAFEEMLNAGTTPAEDYAEKTIPINIDHIQKELDSLSGVSEFEGLEALEDYGNLEATKIIGEAMPLAGAAAAAASIAKEEKPVQVPAPEKSEEQTAADAAAIIAEMFNEKPADETEAPSYDTRDEAAKVRDTIETRIRQIREKEAELERKKGSKGMADARDAYFRAIQNAETASSEEPEKTEEVKEAPVTDEAPVQTESADEEEKKSEENSGDYTQEAQDDYQKALDEVMRQEPQEYRKERSHWFGKLLIAIILIIVVLEAVIMALRYFIPDHEITKIATFGEQLVIEVCKEGYAKASEFISGLIAKYIH